MLLYTLRVHKKVNFHVKYAQHIYGIYNDLFYLRLLTFIQVRITNREKSPYRLMPDVSKRHPNNNASQQNGNQQPHQHYLSAGSSPASSRGID